jgi:pilus assembly protein CpaB
MRGGRIFIIIGIVLFVIVAIGALAYFAIGGPQPAPTPIPEDVTPTEVPSPKVEIVVAAQNIPRGMRITEGNNAVTVIKWPKDALPPDYLTDVESAYGRIARTDIVLGMPVIKGMLTDQAGDLANIGSDAALNIPAGRVGYAIAVTGNSGVAWALRPGDHVDALISLLVSDLDEEYQTPLPSAKVMCVTNISPEGIITVECMQIPIGRSEFLPNGAVTYEGPSGGARPRLVTQMTVQDAIVLQVGTWPNEAELALALAPEPTPVPIDTEDGEAPPPTPIPPTPLTQWVTLAIEPQDALVLKYAEETGASIDFVLRSAGETTAFNTQAVTLDYIFQKYAIEVPPKLPYGVTPPTFAIRSGATGEVDPLDENVEHDRAIPAESELMRYFPICLTDEDGACWRIQ